MKIFVYGCGVIGSLLVHTLCKAGNDVTVVSKGKWGDVLQEKGLHIHHQLQHKDTIDYPTVAKKYRMNILTLYSRSCRAVSRKMFCTS